jgi:EF hand
VSFPLRTSFRGFAVVALAGLGAWAAAPTADTRPPDGAEWLVPGAPAIRARVDVTLDGRSITAVWDEALDRLFADLDRDGNGSLDRAEAARAPSALRLRQIAWGYGFVRPEAAPWADLDVARADEAVTRAELAGYYSRHGAARVQVAIGRAPPNTALTDALLKLLDTDGDGRVSRTEWQAADIALAPLDRDGDDLIRPDELTTGIRYPGTAGGWLLSPTAEPRDAPAAALSLRLSTGHSSPAADVVNVDGTRFTGYAVPGRLPEDLVAARATADQWFAAADPGSTGTVRRAAAISPLSDHFPFADRDSDGRLTRAEWTAYLDLWERLAAGVVVVTVLDHGRGLFELIDADADGALSVRELRGAWSRLEDAGCVRDGTWDRTRLPRQVRWTASLGTPRTLLRSPLRAGPPWFRGMDRNGDGDVSAKEWLGPPNVFRRLDVDGDGLLSADEADRAPGAANH